MFCFFFLRVPIICWQENQEGQMGTGAGRGGWFCILDGSRSPSASIPPSQWCFNSGLTVPCTPHGSFPASQARCYFQEQQEISLRSVPPSPFPLEEEESVARKQGGDSAGAQGTQPTGDTGGTWDGTLCSCHLLAVFQPPTVYAQNSEPPLCPPARPAGLIQHPITTRKPFCLIMH